MLDMNRQRSVLQRAQCTADTLQVEKTCLEDVIYICNYRNRNLFCALYHWLKLFWGPVEYDLEKMFYIIVATALLSRIVIPFLNNTKHAFLHRWLTNRSSLKFKIFEALLLNHMGNCLVFLLLRSRFYERLKNAPFINSEVWRNF